jgi:hypothetical protein
MSRVCWWWACDVCGARVPCAWLIKKRRWFCNYDAILPDYARVEAHYWLHS